MEFIKRLFQINHTSNGLSKEEVIRLIEELKPKLELLEKGERL